MTKNKTKTKAKKKVKNAKPKKEKKNQDGLGIVTLFKTSLFHQTKEFFANSTLHGIRYIAEQGRPIAEKFMWFVFVAVGSVAAFVIIFSLWEKFQTNPTITGLDTDFHNEQVMFPTVVICPFEAFDPEKVNFTARVSLASHEDYYEQYEPFLEELPSLRYETLDSFSAALTNITTNFEKIKDISLRDYIFKIAVSCNDIFHNESCKFRDEKINCCHDFKPFYGEYGFCYAFNSRYYGSYRQEIRNDHIHMLSETDKKWALNFVLKRKSRVFVFSSDDTIGLDFKPQFTWDISYQTELLITMKQTYTTEDCESLTVSQRKCIFPGEKTVDYYKDDVYSFSGCMKECRMKKALRLCGCVPPFYSPVAGVPTPIKYCKIENIECLKEKRGNITSLRGCGHCELSCLNTVYDIEKFTKVMLSESLSELDFRCSIEYLTWPIIRYKREVLFGWVDLLVSFGGIAGLFLGFSILSGVEIVYYFTMRAGCMVYMSRPDLVKMEEEKKNRPLPKYDLGLKPKFDSKNRVSWVPNEKEPQSVIQVQPKSTIDSRNRNEGAPPTRLNDSPILLSELTAIESPVKPKNQVASTSTGSDFLVHNRFRNRETKGVFKLNAIPRPRIFQHVQIAPYSTMIKPLDRKFTFNSSSDKPLYDGYLP